MLGQIKSQVSTIGFTVKRRYGHLVGSLCGQWRVGRLVAVPRSVSDDAQGPLARSQSIIERQYNHFPAPHRYPPRILSPRGCPYPSSYQPRQYWLDGFDKKILFLSIELQSLLSYKPTL